MVCLPYDAVEWWQTWDRMEKVIDFTDFWERLISALHLEWYAISPWIEKEIFLDYLKFEKNIFKKYNILMEFFLPFLSFLPRAQILLQSVRRESNIQEENWGQEWFFGWKSAPKRLDVAWKLETSLIGHLGEAQSGLHVKTIAIIHMLQLSLIQSCCEKMS